jgi:hypothetical protein
MLLCPAYVQHMALHPTCQALALWRSWSQGWCTLTALTSSLGAIMHGGNDATHVNVVTADTPSLTVARLGMVTKVWGPARVQHDDSTLSFAQHGTTDTNKGPG